MDNRIQALCDFLDRSHSAYHAQANLVTILKEQGYAQLTEDADWELAPGGKYYVCRGGAAVIAFRIPTAVPRGFLISAAHTDRPGFKVKENGEQVGAYTRLLTEVYGGALLAPWTDRPLSIAGRVMVETENGAEARLFDIDRDLLLIPNVAIHMNRQANDGTKWNPAVDTIPLLGGKDAKGKFARLLEETVGGKVLGHDLYLYVRQKASVWGIDQEFISSPALDDLQSVWGTFQGFLTAGEGGDIPVFCALNSEEIGSRTTGGADSTILSDVLSRICAGCRLDLHRMLSQSFMISADNAHAVHPNHPEYADGREFPVLNGGVVVKYNAAQRYTTDAVSDAVFRQVCREAGVPVQRYSNRADLPGGSTLGNISTAHLSVHSVDIGLPQLAMHSACEVAGAKDIEYLVRAMTGYFEKSFRAGPEGIEI